MLTSRNHIEEMAGTGAAWHHGGMTAKPSRPIRKVVLSPEAEAEARAAIAEIERGEFIELTPEQLERCITAGEWPWPDESPD